MAKRRRNKNRNHGDRVSVSNEVNKKLKISETKSKTPSEAFEDFISPISVQDFFAKYWEKKPLHIQRSQLTKHNTPLFSREIFEALINSGQHKIHFGRDINVVKYDRKSKERQDPSINGKVTLAKFQKLIDLDRATMQIHQPQRFQDSLWHQLERLESYFGCLVGSNVYTTPANSQGLPPHHDDVEVFILQLEGEKRWRLYSPKTRLASEYEGDFKDEDIGKPIMDFVLKAGDLLYFPRGTIHQAETSKTLSSHITISTYQHYSVGDYLLSTFPQMFEETFKSNVEFRRGLPINFVSNCPAMKSELTDLIQSLLPQIICKANHVPDNMVADFMANRLPPAGVDPIQLRNSVPSGAPPNLKSQVRLKHNDHVCVVVKDDNNQDSASDTSIEEPSTTPSKMIFMYYSVMNTRHNHMMRGNANEQDVTDDDMGAANALKFPYRYLEIINFLRSKCDHFVQACDLPSCDDVDVSNFLIALWSVHLLEHND